MGTYLGAYTGAQVDGALAHAIALSPAHNDTYHTGSSKRNSVSGVAGVDSSNILLLNELPCLREYHINGQQLHATGFRDPDMWILTTNSPTTCSYANRVLTLKSGTGAITAARATIATACTMTSKFLEVTFEYTSYINGAGGTRNNFLGFASSFSAFPLTQRVGFSRDNVNNVSYIVYGGETGGSIRLDACPIGRNIQGNDILTVRMCMQEGSSAIDIVKFYVNGIKQYETTNIPTTSIYAGCGVYNVDADVTTESEMSISYVGFKKLT